MAARTILATRISQVSENAEDVLNLYKEIAEQNTIAAEKTGKFDIVVTDEFKHYASALYVMTMAYSPEIKKQITEGLQTVEESYLKSERYRDVMFIREVQKMNLDL